MLNIDRKFITDFWTLGFFFGFEVSSFEIETSKKWVGSKTAKNENGKKSLF